MRMLQSVLLFSLPFFLIGNELGATEWVPLDRDRPPADVANITDNPDDPPVCIAPGTDMVRVGWLDKDGVCTTAGTDKNAQEHTTGISILSVDSRWQWVSYDGEVPEGAVLNQRDGNPVCRGKGSGRLPFRVGWLDENGRCTTAGNGKKVRGARKNISILIAADMVYEGDAEAKAAARAEDERIRVETERRDAIRADEERRARDEVRAEEDRRRAIDERERAEDKAEQERRDAIDARQRAEDIAEQERRDAIDAEERRRAAERTADERREDPPPRREAPADDRREDPPPRREAPDPPPRREAPADDRSEDPPPRREAPDPPPRREAPADDRSEDPPPRREAPADDSSEDPPPRG